MKRTSLQSLGLATESDRISTFLRSRGLRPADGPYVWYETIVTTGDEVELAGASGTPMLCFPAGTRWGGRSASAPAQPPPRRGDVYRPPGLA
jgi:hypothetical protein